MVDGFRTRFDQSSAFSVLLQDFYDAVPGCLAFWFALGAHEWGHRWAADRRGVELYLPFIIPAGFGFLGSFGAITRVRGFLPNREALLDIATSGPFIGAGVAGAMTFAGFLLTSLGFTDVAVDSTSFSQSLLMGIAAQAFLGDALNQPVMQVCRCAGDITDSRFLCPGSGRRLGELLRVNCYSNCSTVCFQETLDQIIELVDSSMESKRGEVLSVSWPATGEEPVRELLLMATVAQVFLGNAPNQQLLQVSNRDSRDVHNFMRLCKYLVDFGIV